MEKKIREVLRKDFKKLYVKEFTTDWKEQRFLRNIELGIMSLDNTKEFIQKELDRAREEGRREQQKLDCDLYGTSVATEGEIIKGWATDEVELKEGDIVDTPEGKRRIGKTIKLTTK